MLNDHINDYFHIGSALIRNRTKAFKIYYHKRFYRLCNTLLKQINQDY